MNEKPLIFIAGPTGSGKSQLAFNLAKKLHGEIISVDSMKVFIGMDIGTAKPTKEQQNEVPYHLIDLTLPNRHFSMGEFVKRAKEAIEEIQNRNKWVILDGGTALYLKALIWGMFEGPPRNETLRKQLEKEADEKGLESLYQRIQNIDPQATEKIHINDRKRIIRALEVYEETGETLSAQQKQFHSEPTLFHKMYGIQWERAELYERINKRVLQMIEQGWIQEVEKLEKEKEKNGFCSEAASALGYKELLAHLKGEPGFSLEETIALIQQKTRKFAKRQYTWFNNSFPQIQWLNAYQSDKIHLETILKDCQNN